LTEGQYIQASMISKRLSQYFFNAGLIQTDLQALEPHFEMKKLEAGEFWVNQGDEVAHVAFVEKGLFKKAILKVDGSLVIKGFTAEGCHLAPYSALLTNKISAYSIQAIEESLIFELPFEVLNQFFRSNIRFLNFARVIAEQHFLGIEEREIELLTLDSKAMLDSLNAKFPGLISRIPIKDLAAYAGIHPASLSRIRKKSLKK